MSSDLNKRIDQLFELEKLVHSHAGYQEDWVRYPLQDLREYYWKVDPKEEEWLRYAEDPELLPEEAVDSEDYYEDEIFADHFLDKLVFRGEEITLVVTDTKTDGNKFLSILDNAKEIK